MMMMMMVVVVVVMVMVMYSIALVKFAGRDDQYVVVGTVKDLQLRPRSLTCGYLVLYKLSHTGDQLELVHRTEVDDLPAAIAPFQGRLLVGVGRFLRIYDYGKKKLLRKCENKVISLMFGRKDIDKLVTNE